MFENQDKFEVHSLSNKDRKKWPVNLKKYIFIKTFLK